MRFTLPDRWRTRGPHPVTRPGGPQTAEHRTVQVFYQGLPLVGVGNVLLYVADNPGWHARKIGGKWVAVR